MMSGYRISADERRERSVNELIALGKEVMEDNSLYHSTVPPQRVDR